MRIDASHTDEKEIERELSIIQLYTSSFIFVVPLLIGGIILELFYTTNYQNAALFLVTLSGFIFFKFFGKNRVITEHQVCFHQVFVLAIILINFYYFVQNPELIQLIYLMVFGMIASYLWIEFRTTISYFISYHGLLVILSFSYPIIKLEYIFYSLIFSLCALMVNKWVHKLLENSQSLLISEQKYRHLFEDGSSIIFLLKKENSQIYIVDMNARCLDKFGYQEHVIAHKLFSELSADTEEIKENHCEKILKLNNFETLVLSCNYYVASGDKFLSESTFVSIEMGGDRLIQVIVQDVSEKNKNELKLSELVQSFKNIVENSSSTIFIFTDEKLVYKNSKAEEIYSTYLDKTSLNLYEIFPEKDRILLEEVIHHSKETENSYAEIVLGDINNERRFTMNAVPVVYRGKNSIVLNLADITLHNEFNIQRIRAEVAEESNKKLSEEIQRHKETQHDLIENTSKLNALFESSSNLFVLTIDRDLKISSYNSSFKNIMKSYLNVDVVLGIDFLETFPIGQTAFINLIKKFKRSFRGESVELISHFPSSKGEIWVESFISPVKVTGEPIKEIAFIAHNITEKVVNERRIADSEANNRATVSAIPDLLFKVNREGYFTYSRLNKEGESLLNTFAYTTEIEGLHISDVFKHQKQGNIFLQNIKKALRTGTVHRQNFIIPFIIGKTDKKMVYENRYSRVNNNEVIVISRNVTDKVEFETQLIESVKEKEILLKEVHHRVKNNLQVISSILNLQSSYVEDEKTLEIINESQNRIRSMSYIHESLYQTKDFSSIDFHDYITNLVQNLVHSYQIYSGKTQLKLDVERIQLVLDQAIPCGLILNELVSNSLKYAYPEEEGGEIQIEIKENDNKITIRVEDFGTGLPKGFKIEESESLGLGLVDTLVDQIDGQLILETDFGTKYLIIFEKQEL